MLKFRLFLLLFALVLTGAGCFGFGADNTANSDGGVFKSTSAGDVWTQVSAVPGPKGVGTIGGRSITVMEMDPQDHEMIYIGTRASGLLYSEDGGASWRQPKATNLKTGEISDIEVDPKDVCTVYIAKGPRLYKSDNCLRDLDDETYVETRSKVTLRQVVVDWFNPKVVWLALSNGDILKSTDGGDTWRTMVSAENDITALIISNTDSRILLAGTDQNGFFKTTDGGKNWVQIEKELKDYRNANRVYGLTQDEKSSAVIAATKFGLLRSPDFGNSWTPIELLTAAGQVTIKALSVDPKDAGKIYYAALNTLYSTKDGGVTWTTHQIPTTKIPEVLLIDPTNTSVLYVGVAAPVK
ncbi:hypothetical protein KJ611_00460 [Patescibacteria group bacterium]|nr:hypothetical protein [Patescibacteria group bacterium]MBU1705764.1 hypothetical protein [Patescibacteria group bacterium]